jgi:flagellar assembly protein FliH
LRARAEVECARIQQEAVDTASRQAAEMIERARSEAESLLAQARAEIEAVEREARQRGRQQAQEEVELEMAAELERLAGLLTCAREERLRVMADHESALVDLAVEIAGRLVRAELQLDRQAIVRIAQEALETAATTETLQLHLCPDDAAWLGERMSAAWRAEGVVLVANETIEPGGCLLVTAHGRVDARLGSRLGEIRAALAQELS